MNMKLTVKELRCLIDIIHDKRINEHEEINWWLRNIYNSLSDIKETMEETDTVTAIQPPEEIEEIPY